jgi:peptide deformylase
MYKSMSDPENPGVGIAAPQVGINRRVIWVERQDKPGNPAEVYFNPEIIQFGEQWLYGVEGCLSVPDKSGYVRRARTILLQYDDINGEQKIELIEAYTARIFQHEIDHLNGIMYIDHLDE